MKMSESIGELAKALSQFQGKVNNVNPSATNPFFKSKYAPLEEVLKEVRPKLASEGLSIMQYPLARDHKVGVVTVLMHESGEYIQTEELLLVTDKNTAQGAGSAITYARRYALSAILGVAADEDDDGNVAEIKKEETKKSNTTKGSTNKQQSSDFISEAQIKRLYAIANSKGIDSKAVDAAVQKQLNIKVNQLNKTAYDQICSSYERLEDKK